MNRFEPRRHSAPTDFEDNYYIYIPNLPAAIVAMVFWVLILSAIAYRSWRFKIWYLSVLMFGLGMEVVGYILRIYGHDHLNAYVPYVVMQAFTILAPVMFAAGNYVIFGRLLHYGSLLYPGKKLTWLPTHHVVAVFVTSDIISFLVQMGGAILLLGQNNTPERQQAGQNTLMAGLAINLASFCFFFTLVVWYEVATRRLVRHLPNKKRSYATIVCAVMFSQFFLIGRSIYRVIEFQQGYFSPIATTELYFYLFDTMLMIFATVIYIPFFPPAFGLLGKKRLALKLEEESVEMGATSRTRDQENGTTGIRSEDDCLITE